MGRQMLNRREFLKLSAVLSAGAVIALSSPAQVLAWDQTPPRVRPILQYHGHSRSGCAFRPELTDIWAGGGAQLPDMI